MTWQSRFRLLHRSELVHAARKLVADIGPVASENASSTLPSVVYLNVLSAVVLQVSGDPLGVLLHLVFVNLLIVVIPGAPARGRQRKL